MLLVVLSACAPRPAPDPLLRAPALQIACPPPPALLPVARLALVSNMSLPPILTNLLERSTLWRRARRPADTVSDLIRHRQHT